VASGVVESELGAADWVVEVDFEDFVGGGVGVCTRFEGPERGCGLDGTWFNGLFPYEGWSGDLRALTGRLLCTRCRLNQKS
jgi:hypothetical protein